MGFQSVNSYNGKKLFEQAFTKIETLEKQCKKLKKGQKKWRSIPVSERVERIKHLAQQTQLHINELAKTATLEMGKPLAESIAEIKKCIWLCEYYADNAETFLTKEYIKTDATESFVQHAPMGCILGIMPWNFPYWQVFRFMVPTLLAGNAVALKHAPNVGLSAKFIAQLMQESGLASVFTNLFASTGDIEHLLNQNYFQGVSLTGSTGAGKKVAELAGKNILPVVLELGGSNAMLIFEDADLKLAAKTAINARFLNAGQSCIAAKRIIVHHQVYDAFKEELLKEFETLTTGNPLEKGINIGPLARRDLADKLMLQIRQSIDKGATPLGKIKQEGCLVHPLILEDVTQKMPVFNEETFGPVLALVKANNEKDMLKLAKRTVYGLGISLMGRNTQHLLSLAEELNEGAVFINDLVKSDPRLPFGGVKQSGVGRELGKDGILAFVNRKTIVVK